MRYFFEIAYKGTDFHGWQKQPNALSIQEVVENKFSTYMKEEVNITGSGRTDTGVHCEQQFFHCDLNREFTKSDLFKLNSFIPGSILLRNFWLVSDEKHARFDATLRKYHYCISRDRNPFLLDTSYHFHRPLDLDTMNKASQLLLGEKDFRCFSKVKTEVHTFICDLKEAEWSENNGTLTFTISGNRFLRGMVRAIVGTLLEIGEGKRTIEEFIALMDSGDRRLAGAAAPAKGLTLKEVHYPNSYFEK